MIDLILYNIGFLADKILMTTAFAVVLVLIIRRILRFEKYITIDHIELVNKLMLGLGIVVWFSYLLEIFNAWYSGYIYEQFVFYNRLLGNYWYLYVFALLANIIVPLFLAIKKVRRSLLWTFVISLMINATLIFKRWLIMVYTSLGRNYLPSSWDYY